MKTNEHMAGDKPKKINPVDRFYDDPTPENACKLAAADSRAMNGTQEFIHKLNKAADICADHAANLARIAELERALDSLIDVATRALDQSVTHDGLNNCDALAAARHALKGTK